MADDADDEAKPHLDDVEEGEDEQGEEDEEDEEDEEESGRRRAEPTPSLTREEIQTLSRLEGVPWEIEPPA